MFSFLIVDFEYHVSVCAFNQMSSLGIETQVYFGLPFPRLVVPSHGAQGHVFGVTSGLFGMVEYGEYARIQLVIIPEEILGHLFVVEHILRIF